MGKRYAVATENDEQQYQDKYQNIEVQKSRSGRKRKCPTTNQYVISLKNARLNDDWQEENQQSFASPANNAAIATAGAINCIQTLNTPTAAATCARKIHNNSTLFLNATLNASFSSSTTTPTRTNDHNSSNVTESPKPVYTLCPSVANNTVLRDLKDKSWRLGKPIGKGNFGEIFLASDKITAPVTCDNAKYVVKIEPHSNGPLFVEIHCLMNTAKNNNNNNSIDSANTTLKSIQEYQHHHHQQPKLSTIPPTGIPNYIASGSHVFGDIRYRFLVLERFDRDLHSLIKNSQVHNKFVLTLAIHIVDVLEQLHDRGYCHNDVKAQNLMISKCKYFKQKTALNNQSRKYDDDYKQQTTDSGNSSEQEANEYDFKAEQHHHEQQQHKIVLKRELSEEEDEDFDDGATTNSNSSCMDNYHTPQGKQRKQRVSSKIEFSGSNPVRSCRRDKRHSIYDEMVKSHYLRPTKRVSYKQFFNEDGSSIKESTQSTFFNASAESEEFVPARHLPTNSTSKRYCRSKIKSAISSKNQTNGNSPIKRLTRRQEKLLKNASNSEHQQHQQQQELLSRNTSLRKNRKNDMSPTTTHTEKFDYLLIEEERIFLIDYGLASKYQDRGIHRPFIMDQRRAHDGTLEFTSRDAHLGAHSRRSDLECLGYNLLFWSQGYLPWKDAALQQQQEKVHRSKELLMTDVREMLKQIYGKQVPKYLGEFLHNVGQLAYQERPDYEQYRNMFRREYEKLGYSFSELHLNSSDIMRTCIKIREDVDGGGNKCGDIMELNNKQNNCTAKNVLMITPYQESSLTNRISPKNLRSKSDKKTLKKKKFSWAEVLSQDPDQIARERAVKEFEREEVMSPDKFKQSRRFQGKPTYAIMQLLERRKFKGRRLHLDSTAYDENTTNAVGHEVEDTDESFAYNEQDMNDDEEIDDESMNEEIDEQDEDEVEEDDLDCENDDEENDNENEEEDDDNGDDGDNSDDDDDEDDDDDNDDDDDDEDDVDDEVTETDASSESIVKSQRGGRQPLENAIANEIKTKSTNIRSSKRVVTNVAFTTKTRSSNCSTKLNKALLPIQPPNTNTNHILNHNHKNDNANTHSKRKIKERRVLATSGDDPELEENNVGVKPIERRTRRCLIKASARNYAYDDDGDESNSNEDPDIRRLTKIWRKFDNESIYARGRNTALTTARGYLRK